MSVNSMSFEQAATLLNAVNAQVTGKTGIAPTDVHEFISVAQKTLQAGYDPVMNAITQVIGRTIYSIRPYSAKFGGIQMDSQKWGAITRKLVVADKPLENNKAFDLVDGQSVDMYEISKPMVLELKYYGAMQFSKHYTIFKDQLDNAFRGPDEFGSFMAMVTQNTLDMIEQTKESMARMAIGNFIAGKIDAANGVIHLLTEYNTETGSSLDATTVYAPANFPNFIKWAYARIATLTGLLTERSEEFQIKVTGYDINRHTPLDRQKVYIFSDILNGMDARVLADAFHNDFLEFSDVAPVNYWQSIDDRMKVSMTPVVLKADGTLDNAAAAVVQDKVVGVIFDEDALGYTLLNEFQGVTPFNPRGEYWNQFYNYVIRYYNDFTEKGLVLLLD